MGSPFLGINAQPRLVAPVYEPPLAIKQKVLGPRHADTVMSRGALGLAPSALGQVPSLVCSCQSVYERQRGDRTNPRLAIEDPALENVLYGLDGFSGH